jgi:hypothetical protein
MIASVPECGHFAITQLIYEQIQQITCTDLGTDGRITLKYILEELDIKVWTGSNWLRMGSSGRLL